MTTVGQVNPGPLFGDPAEHFREQDNAGQPEEPCDDPILRLRYGGIIVIRAGVTQPVSKPDIEKGKSVKVSGLMVSAPILEETAAPEIAIAVPRSRVVSFLAFFARLSTFAKSENHRVFLDPSRSYVACCATAGIFGRKDKEVGVASSLIRELGRFDIQRALMMG